MAVLFLNGFDTYTSSNDIAIDTRLDRMDTNNNFDNEIMVTASTRFATGRALRIQDDGGVFYALNDTIVQGASVAFGFAVQADVHSDLQGIAGLSNSGRGGNNANFKLQTKAGGRIEVRKNTSGGTIYHQTSAAILSAGSTGPWHYLEYSFQVSTAAFINCYIDGVLDSISSTAVDLVTDMDLPWNQMRFGDHVSNEGIRQFDDSYVVDDSGGSSATVSRLGDIRVKAFHPATDAIPSDWVVASGVSSHVMLSQPQEVSSFIEASVVGITDMWLIDVSGEIGAVDTVHAVQIHSKMRKEDAGSAEVSHIVSVSTVALSAAANALGTSYEWHSNMWDRHNGESDRWTASTLNGANFGVKIVE